MSFFKDALTRQLPAVLWHGSAYGTEVLKPGFLWSHKLVEWDRGESNHYLYATTEKETAVAMGFASAIEKRYELDRFHCEGDTITVESPSQLTHYDLEHLAVWLYELHPKNSEQWVYNHNAHNELDTEFKTHRIVPWVQRDLVNLHEWLGTKDVIIKKT